MRYDPLKDGKSSLELLNKFDGDLDLQVVNDAKASYERESTSMGVNEIRLIERLLGGITEPQHTSPLRGIVFKFKVKCPLFVARQWYKHHVASSYVDCQDGWNETSHRYVEVKEEFYIPAKFYEQDLRNKQAAALPIAEDLQEYARRAYEVGIDNAYGTYKQLINMGVVREQARAVLPPSVYTSFHWTVSLQALLNFLDLRMGHGAQTEIVAYADVLYAIAHTHAPHTVTAWFNRKAIINAAMEMYNNGGR